VFLNTFYAVISAYITPSFQQKESVGQAIQVGFTKFTGSKY